MRPALPRQQPVSRQGNHALLPPGLLVQLLQRVGVKLGRFTCEHGGCAQVGFADRRLALKLEERGRDLPDTDMSTLPMV